ncbi:TetR/AcrR family transcriptional regulator [Streptacidiphilus cavernicola]|uniref:TetR/AcrR family transcriptional regulator n=1 Tax=Streptacidiphilus cavernicola TaxID=3342716 RepID=A0ABV6VVW2_9ACTN
MAYRPTARTEAARAAQRERLLEAARGLLAEGGYAATGVVVVAERAGVATGSVYRHFASRQELLAAVFQHVAGHELDAVREAVREAVRAQRGAAEQLRVLVEVFSHRALRAPRTAWALLAEPVDPLVQTERLAYRRGYLALAREAIAEGVATGELPPQEPSLSAAAVVGAIGEALLGPLSPVGALSPAEPPHPSAAPSPSTAADQAATSPKTPRDPAAETLAVQALVALCLRAVGATAVAVTATAAAAIAANAVEPHTPLRPTTTRDRTAP